MAFDTTCSLSCILSPLSSFVTLLTSIYFHLQIILFIIYFIIYKGQHTLINISVNVPMLSQSANFQQQSFGKMF